ncbi:hypothetical protein V6N11_081138 [Hibiscus sabdariffa]|uniref:Amino acid transporter transmembrane domain-containing protein n=1 Tax=Hibiscus sabdariffa TaxID=183260 RepID=A0ABR2QJ49_9ROSI
MKKATSAGISITTMFYISCGSLGYAAFGSNAPGNFLTGFGFFEPYWLIDIANMFIIVHLVGAYQYLETCMANSLRDNDSRGGDDSPILQRHPWSARRRFVLAVDGVFPDPNAHIKRKHSTLLLEMDMVKHVDRGLLDHITSRSRWLHCSHF